MSFSGKAILVLFIVLKFLGLDCAIPMSDLSAIPLEPEGSAAGVMVFDSLTGKLTKHELEQIKSYARDRIPDPVNNFTPGRNGFVYGTLGNAFETLVRLYELTGDREILDILVNWTDHIVNARNDLPGGEKRVIWNGEVAPVWPNEENLYKVPDSEQGEIIGKIYNVALLIYQTPALYHEAVSVGDSLGYGETYAGRAATYVARAEEALKGYLIPTFIHRPTNQIRYPEDPRFYDGRAAGNMNAQTDMNRVMMTNRQFMVAHAFMCAAEVYDHLGNAEFADFCADVTQKSLDSFENSIVKRNAGSVWSWLFPKHRIYAAEWNYWPEKDGYTEDAGHGAFDMISYFRILKNERYRSKEDTAEAVCNMILYKLHIGNGNFASSINGSIGDSPAAQIRENYLLMAAHDPEIMNLITADYVASSFKDASKFGTVLYLKGVLNGVEA